MAKRSREGRAQASWLRVSSLLFPLFLPRLLPLFPGPDVLPARLCGPSLSRAEQRREEKSAGRDAECAREERPAL